MYFFLDTKLHSIKEKKCSIVDKKTIFEIVLVNMFQKVTTSKLFFKETFFINDNLWIERNLAKIRY